MEKEFVPYELALRMKQLGFNEPCFGLYAPPSKTVFLHHYGLLSAKEQILAPLYQQCFRWFREKYTLIYFIGDDFGGWSYSISKNSKPQGSISAVYSTYEEAELACLEKLIEIVEQKEN
jgi:hypothetical protein